MHPPAKNVINSLNSSHFSRKTCCMLLAEHIGERGEEEEVVDDMEGGAPVDDNASWSITLLAHPST